MKAFESIPNTSPFDVTGHPALSINAGFSDGLPVGMMIVGRKFDEATVLNVAYAYEKIRDTHGLRTFAPKNFPRTDFFKTLTDGRK